MRFAIEQPFSLGKKTASTVFDETKIPHVLHKDIFQGKTPTVGGSYFIWRKLHSGS